MHINKIILLLTGIVIASCNQPVEKTYKYEVWVGTAVFSVAYETNNVQKVGSDIVFLDKDNTKITIDKSKVLKIEEHNR